MNRQITTISKEITIKHTNLRIRDLPLLLPALLPVQISKHSRSINADDERAGASDQHAKFLVKY